MTTANKSLVLPNLDDKTCKQYGRELVNIGVDVIPMNLTLDTSSESRKYNKKPLVYWKEFQTKSVTAEIFDEWCNRFLDDEFNGLAIIGGKKISALDLDNDFDEELLSRLHDLGTASYETERGWHFLTLADIESADAIYKEKHVGEFLGSNHLIVIPPSADRQFLITTVRDSKFPSLVKPKTKTLNNNSNFSFDYSKVLSRVNNPFQQPKKTFQPSEKWHEGERNNELSKYSFGILNNFENIEDYRAEVHRINDENCVPPLPAQEVNQMIETKWNNAPDYVEPITTKSKFHPFLSLDSVMTASSHFNYEFITKYESFFKGGDVKFRLGSALAILSTAINPKITFSTGQKTTSSIWVMLVGESSISYKSTVIDDAERLMTDAGMEEVKTADNFSPERLENAMSERDGRPNIFMHNEFAGFLQTLSQDNSRGLSNLMIRLWDGKDIRKELVGRDNKAKTDEEGNSYREPEVYRALNPHLSSLVGIQTERFTNAMNQKQLWDGYLLRWIIIPSENPRRKKMSELRAQSFETHKWNELVRLLSTIFQQNRTSTFNQDISDEALELFDDYFDYIDDQILSLPEGDICRNLFGRYKTQAEKLCLIVSRSRSSNMISLDDVRFAICLNEIFRIKTQKFLTSNAISTLEKDMNKVIRFLDNQPDKTASKTELNRGVTGWGAKTSKHTEDILLKMQDMGFIVSSMVKNKTLWKLVDKSEDDGADEYASELVKILFSNGSSLHD